MNDKEYYFYQDEVRKASELLEEVCSIVFEKYPHWSNKGKAMRYALSQRLISKEEYDLVIGARIL